MRDAQAYAVGSTRTEDEYLAFLVGLGLDQDEASAASAATRDMEAALLASVERETRPVRFSASIVRRASIVLLLKVQADADRTNGVGSYVELAARRALNVEPNVG